MAPGWRRRDAGPGLPGATRVATAGLLLITLVAVACGRVQRGGSARPSGDVAPRTDVTVVRGAPATPPVPFITDDAVVGPHEVLPLGGRVGPTFSAYLSPAAVPSPDGTLIAYNAWTDLVPFDPERSWSQLGVKPGDPVGTPSIRLIDVRTGRGTTLADGAYSIAWRSDGAVAYVQGVERDYRANVRSLGQVVVRPSLEAAPEAWTSERAHYVAYGWAGRSLLVYRIGEGEELDVLALDGAGEARLLAAHARIIAVSPDGARALLFRYDPRAIELFEVATGQRLALLDLAQAEPAGDAPPTVDVLYSGSWAGDLVAAVVTRADASTGLALVRVTDGGLGLAGVLGFPPRAFPMGIAEPQLLDPSGPRVIAVAPLPGKGEAAGTVYVYLDCDLAVGRCAEGPPVTDRVFHPIYNPSRPIQEGVGDG